MLGHQRNIQRKRYTAKGTREIVMLTDSLFYTSRVGEKVKMAKINDSSFE
jgi:hypothetical protein